MTNLLLWLSVGLNLQFFEAKPFHIYNYHVNYKNERDDKGNYEFKYNTQFYRPEDDVGRSKTGRIGKTSSGEDVLRVNGSYHYWQECDHRIEIFYIADEKGYRTWKKEFLNRTYKEVDGRKVVVQRLCGAVAPKRIGGACLASLQGGCAG